MHCFSVKDCFGRELLVPSITRYNHDYMKSDDEMEDEEISKYITFIFVLKVQISYLNVVAFF